MKLSKEQRAALEAAGYKISKSGKTVEGKNGGTIGGINENGKFFAGSQKVMDILRNPPKLEAPKQAPASRSSAPAKPRSPVSSGRGDGKAETARRAADRPKISSGRGDGAAEATRRRAEARQNEKKPATGAVAAAGAVAGAVAIGAAAARKRARDARRVQASPRGTAYNPSYTGKPKMAEGPQGRYATGVGRPRGPSAAGAALNPGRSARRLAGGRMNSLDPRNNPYKLD